jgi:hypothetical protein
MILTKTRSEQDTKNTANDVRIFRRKHFLLAVGFLFLLSFLIIVKKNGNCLCRSRRTAEECEYAAVLRVVTQGNPYHRSEAVASTYDLNSYKKRPLTENFCLQRGKIAILSKDNSPTPLSLFW